MAVGGKETKHPFCQCEVSSISVIMERKEKCLCASL